MKHYVLGVTGGIASGKSYVCAMLKERGLPVFSCDDEARTLMLNNATLRKELQNLIGTDAYLENGALNKSLIRNFITSGGQEAINTLVHPFVRNCFEDWKRAQEETLLVMECALLFESGFDELVDKSLFVKAPTLLRIERLISRNHIDEKTARSLIDIQMSEEEKECRADFVICNDGISDLAEQIEKLLVEMTF